MTNSDYPEISEARDKLLSDLKELPDKKQVLHSKLLVELMAKIKDKPLGQRAAYGSQVNNLKKELSDLITSATNQTSSAEAFDPTAPIGYGGLSDTKLLSATDGSIHPINQELNRIVDIFYRMGFSAVESPEIDDDFHMFGSLNFPEGHPARDDYDTFATTIKDKDGKPYVAPAHTSTMQYRVLKDGLKNLEKNQPIATVIPGKVFRKEDIDPRHEHTFYQVEGVYVDKGVTVANLISTLKEALSAYFDSQLEIKSQPYYFPFTEPSFEFSISCLFCQKNGCRICSQSGWIELLGCGLIHPNVLTVAGIDPDKYSGFAFGLGFMRMAMIRLSVDDIRLFLSGRLDFLRQF